MMTITKESGPVDTYTILAGEYYEEILYSLTKDLSYHRKHDPDMTYKISYDGEKIVVKKYYRFGSSN